jgi:hypothetical protein
MNLQSSRNHPAGNDELAKELTTIWTSNKCLTSWTLITTAGCFTDWHRDAAGSCTQLLMVYSCKIWFMEDEDGGVSVQVLKAGNML